nr:glucose-1-phosphate thymidylyltransferase [Actinomadura rayongensis]
MSGGTGTRLRPFSHSMPKQLMPVGNKPVLEHVLDNVRAMGATEVGIIVNRWAPEIRSRIGDGSALGIDVTYLPQDGPRGLAHTVIVAREFLGDDDFVMYLGDSMLGDGDLAEISAEFQRTRPDAHVVVGKVADPRAFGVVELDRDGAVVRLEEKPERPRSDLALTGVYFFTAAVHAAIDAIEPSARGELEITDAIQWLVSAGARVRASQFGGYYRDTGRVEDVLECNRKVLENLRPKISGAVEDSELIGSVVVEAGARVVRSRIEGPAIVGAGSTVVDCRVGPHTSIGDGCVLDEVAIDYSIVLDGATLTRTGGLRASLIGRHASVGGPSEGGTRRLVLGDHSRVETAA